MDENAGEDAVDPRVKDQLELLNSYTDEINTLELQLDDANATFRNTLSEYSQRLKILAKRLGKCVQIARPYYEAEEAARKAKLECEKAAIRYHRACGIHKAARETIAVAEQKFNNKQSEWEFDAAWQEMLNRETMKVMNAESLKEESENEHKKTTKVFALAEERLKVLEHKLKKAIIKSRPYFEQKTVFLQVLQDLKGRVESLQKAVIDAKTSYANCLHNLEMISKEIHERRKLLLQPREPGVGAEHEIKSVDFSIYPPLAKLQLSDNESQITDTSTDTEAVEDAEHDVADLSSVPTLSLPLLEVISRQTTVSSEPSIKTPAHQNKPETLSCDKKYNDCANASWSTDKSLPSSVSPKSKKPPIPSIKASSSYDTFEEVDLTCD